MNSTATKLATDTLSVRTPGACTVQAGWWWADLVAGLVILPIIANEGQDRLRGKACSDDCGWCLKKFIPGQAAEGSSPRAPVPCLRSRSRMAVNIDRTCGIARLNLSATGQ